MKQLISIAFLFALLVSGCSQEEMVKNGQTLKLPKVTASFDQNESRTYIENGNLLRWNENDQISFFYQYTFNSQYQFDGDTGDNAGTFSPVNQMVGTGNALDGHNYAVYPYASGIKITENGVITTSLPSEQSFAENSFGLGDNTMVAVTEDKNDTFLKFQNVSGYLMLRLYGEDVTMKTITLTGNNNEKLAGKATVTSTYGGEPSVSMAAEATETITLDCGEGVELGTSAETATPFWFVVPPTTFENGFTITVEDVNGGEFTKTTSKTIEIERNAVQPMAAFEVKTEKKPLVKSVYVSTAGELYKQISDSEKYNITSIKISGELNGTDIRFIREMIGRDVNNNITSGMLVDLDLSEASIVEGGEVYYEDSSIRCNTSMNTVGEYMFYYCEKLQNIVLPNNAVSIGWRAFSGCGGLISIKMFNGIISIGQSAFGNCTSLVSIDLPETLVSIDYGAFIGCTSLISLDISDSVTSIGQHAIYNCTSLTSLTIGDGMKSIPYGIIHYCSNLTTLVIGNGVTYIDYSAFDHLYSLTSVTIGSGITSIYKDAFENCDKITEFYCYATTPPRIDSSFEPNIKGKATLYVPAGCESKYNSSDWGYLFYVKGMY